MGSLSPHISQKPTAPTSTAPTPRAAPSLQVHCLSDPPRGLLVANPALWALPRRGAAGWHLPILQEGAFGRVLSPIHAPRGRWSRCPERSASCHLHSQAGAAPRSLPHLEPTLTHLGASRWPGEGHPLGARQQNLPTEGAPGPGTASVASYRPGTSLLVPFQPVTPFHCSWSRASPSSSGTGGGARPPRCAAACQGDSPGAASSSHR